MFVAGEIKQKLLRKFSEVFFGTHFSIAIYPKPIHSDGNFQIPSIIIVPTDKSVTFGTSN